MGPHYIARRLGRYRTVTERQQRMGMSDQVCGGTIFAKLSVCGALIVLCCMQEGFESTGRALLLLIKSHVQRP